ncbi:MAG TPA: hypothetical protein DD457_07460 [Gammaproteobacteria bacterium]|nr:hypothetical protein [Gammaproteobacteria bacterium]|tara:strand:- start:3620 stop:4066 length:447 start_codon:yes stop_codon:yes gene_type:complete
MRNDISVAPTAKSVTLRDEKGGHKMFDWNGVKTKANSDGEFGIHARMWDSTLRISIGDEKTRIDIEGGTIREIQDWYGGGPTDLAISASQQDWDELLRSVPKPFYQDLYPASIHHGFEITGDRDNYCAYYPAIRRLIEILREVRNAEV